MSRVTISQVRLLRFGGKNIRFSEIKRWRDDVNYLHVSMYAIINIFGTGDIPFILQRLNERCDLVMQLALYNYALDVACSMKSAAIAGHILLKCQDVFEAAFDTNESFLSKGFPSIPSGFLSGAFDCSDVCVERMYEPVDMGKVDEMLAGMRVPNVRFETQSRGPLIPDPTRMEMNRYYIDMERVYGVLYDRVITDTEMRDALYVCQHLMDVRPSEYVQAAAAIECDMARYFLNVFVLCHLNASIPCRGAYYNKNAYVVFGGLFVFMYRQITGHGFFKHRLRFVVDVYPAVEDFTRAVSEIRDIFKRMFNKGLKPLQVYAQVYNYKPPDLNDRERSVYEYYVSEEVLEVIKARCGLRVGSKNTAVVYVHSSMVDAKNTIESKTIAFINSM